VRVLRSLSITLFIKLRLSVRSHFKLSYHHFDTTCRGSSFRPNRGPNSIKFYLFNRSRTGRPRSCQRFEFDSNRSTGSLRFYGFRCRDGELPKQEQGYQARPPSEQQRRRRQTTVDHATHPSLCQTMIRRQTGVGKRSAIPVPVLNPTPVLALIVLSVATLYYRSRSVRYYIRPQNGAQRLR
jgi:hypothetical protein